jgi:hypothetical protein
MLDVVSSASRTTSRSIIVLPSGYAGGAAPMIFSGVFPGGIRLGGRKCRSRPLCRRRFLCRKYCGTSPANCPCQQQQQIPVWIVDIRTLCVRPNYPVFPIVTVDQPMQSIRAERQIGTIGKLAGCARRTSWSFVVLLSSSCRRPCRPVVLLVVVRAGARRQGDEDEAAARTMTNDQECHGEFPSGPIELIFKCQSIVLRTIVLLQLLCRMQEVVKKKRLSEEFKNPASWAPGGSDDNDYPEFTNHCFFGQRSMLRTSAPPRPK